MTEPRRRLDQPKAARGLRRPTIDPEAVGTAAEGIARFFGTARYLVIQTAIVIVWIGVNVVWGLNYAHSKNGCVTTQHIVGSEIQQEQTPNCTKGKKPFDPYPFILLNLAFSTQAAYAAPLILLAQTRQAARDKATEVADAKHREDLSERALEQGRQIQELIRQNTELTQAVHDLTEKVHNLVAKGRT